jgi:hypothetical protein
MAGPGAGAPGAPAGGAPGRRPAGAFIISIVPLNFGAAAPFRLNPHFLQVVAASSFSVPQFGQNTRSLPQRFTGAPSLPLLRSNSQGSRRPIFPRSRGRLGPQPQSGQAVVPDRAVDHLCSETRGAGISGTGMGTGTFTGMSLDTPLCGSLRFASPARPPGKFSRKFMQPELGSLARIGARGTRAKPRKR